MNILSYITILVNNSLSKVGYRIERRRNLAFGLIDVLDLAIHKVNSLNPLNPHFYFLQIGANDGLTYDPIRKYVLRHHWRGLLVEPIPAVFAKLLENYKGENLLSFENAAVTAADGVVTLYSVDDRTPGSNSSLYSTLDRRLLLETYGPDVCYSELKIPGVSVTTLLTRHAVSKIDLLQIDTEGYDFEVIKSIDFERVRPVIIHYEHIHLTLEERYESYRYLNARGYNLAFGQWDTVALLRTANEEL